MFDMSLATDAEIAAENAKKVAALVKTLHEAPHHGFFGETAEQRRVDAAVELGKMKAYGAIPDLALALKDENWAVRVYASQSISHMADHAQSVEPELREALKDRKIWVRIYAASALWTMDAASTELIPVLTGVTDNDDVLATIRAADLAIAIEKDPKDFVPVLMRGLDDPKAAYRVVSTISGETHYAGYLPVLLKGTENANPKVRVISANLLEAKVYASPRTTDTLRRLAVEDPDEAVRMNAVQSLVNGGQGKDAGIPAGTAEGRGEETIALLVKLLQGNDAPVRHMAAEALGYAKLGNPEIIAALMEHLDDPDNDVRKACASALGDLGEPAKVAVPKLWALFNANQKAIESKTKISAEDDDFADKVFWALFGLGERPARLHPD
jgi:HEAT repeat protein